MKKIFRRAIDKLGISVFRNRRLPIGTDYRKTLRERFGNEAIEIVLDVGANIGQFCIHCNEVFSAAEIYGFEPVRDTFLELENRTNKLKNIQCFNFALGSEKGHGEIFLQSNSTVNSLNPAVNKTERYNQKSEMVTINTVDSFCQEQDIEKIDLLKIDTEGFDLNVLIGAQEMIRKRKVSFVFVEVTFDKDKLRNSQFSEISAWLEERGFKLYGFFNQSVHEGSTRMNFCDALFYLQPIKP